MHVHMHMHAYVRTYTRRSIDRDHEHACMRIDCTVYLVLHSTYSLAIDRNYPIEPLEIPVEAWGKEANDRCRGAFLSIRGAINGIVAQRRSC